MKYLFIAAVLISALPCCSQSSAAQQPALRVANAALQATMSRDGSYSVAYPAAQWKLEGQLPSAVSALHSTGGVDRIGAYRELSEVWDSGARRAEIRVYQSRPLALLNDVWLRSDANAHPFPTFQSLPADALQVSYRDDDFGIYEF